MNIFLFHRDFRIEDNRGLIALAREEKEIYLVFILTKDQTKNNPLFNSRAFEVMIFVLQKLNKRVHVNVLEAENEVSAIKKLLNEGMKINKIYTNKDFTPYALKRSNELKELAAENSFIYKEIHDYLLFTPDQIKKPDNSFYQVFTPYWNHARINKKVPQVLETPKFKALKLKNTVDLNKLKSNDFGLPLTREKVEVLVTRLSKDYQLERNNLALYKDGTTHISAAIKFGVISIREVHWWAIKRFGYFSNSFSRQLMWRDFFYQVCYNAMIENKWQFSTNWIKKMNNLTWENDKQKFEKWKNGETGVPLVDAGMHELNDFGTMHNRVRMVCGSYLVKNLNVDWQWGEQYFATKLLDYDPIVNQCSWQWVAGTGFDAQPFIRIFNPYLQQEKFDSDLVYTKHFLKDNKIESEIVDFKSSVQAAKKRYNDIK